MRIPAKSSGRGRSTLSCDHEFLRQRISQHGNLVADADAPKAAPQRELCRFAGRHQPAQRLAGRRSGREQSLLGGKISGVAEVLCTAETVGEIVVAEPTEIEPRSREDRIRILHAACRFDERDGEDRSMMPSAPASSTGAIR